MKKARLREGFTTGTSAAAAAHAAVARLLGGAAAAIPTTVDVALPPFSDDLKPPFPRLSIAIAESGTDADGSAWAAVVKDGGDDPDATHGARIIVYAAKWAWRGGAPAGGSVIPHVFLYGGEGVGVVTLPGLPVEPGEPAINPEPRRQISFAALEAAARYGYSGPLHLLIRVPDGLKRAKKTMNARLGIMGGISILGTHGIVKPYSVEAWKAIISQGVSVAASLGLDTLLFSTGRRSERLGFGLYPELAPQCGVQAADFAAFAMREAAGRGFARIIWCCFPGKLLKLAQGLEWTHAKSAAVDTAMLARYAAKAGASDDLMAQITAVPTATGIFALLEKNPAVHDTVLRRVGDQAFAVLQGWLRQGPPESCCPELTLCVFRDQSLALTIFSEAKNPVTTASSSL